MAYFCKHCGNPLPEASAFCPFCGGSLAEPAQPQQPQYQQPQYRQPQQPAYQQPQYGQPQQPAYRQPVNAQKPAYQPQKQPQRHYTSQIRAQEAERAAQMNTAGAQEPKPAKKKKGSKVFLGFLAAALIAAFLFTGFVAPGFLRKKEPVFDGYDAYVPEEEEEDYLEALTASDFEIPDLEPSGASSIVFDNAAYSVKPETAQVDIEHPEAELPGGVKVRFGDFCLYEEPQELQVRYLGERNDGEYECVGYDLTLDGEGAEFLGHAEITVPYDAEWGDDVFVQYLNEETGAWEIIYAEPNGDATVTFRTDHFCNFAVFSRMVKDKNTTSPGNGLWVEVKGDNELGTTVRLSWMTLAAMLRDGKLEMDTKLSDLTSKPDAYFEERATTILNNTVTGIDYFAKATKIPGVSKVLGPLGQVITVGKFLREGHTKGWSKAIDRNGMDLVMLGVGIGAGIPGPVGWICAGTSFCYYVYSTGKAIKTDYENGGQDSIVEYAYREFTKNYIIYNEKTGEMGALYYRDEDDLNNWKLTNKKFFTQGNDFLQITDNVYSNSNWADVFRNAESVGKKGKMSSSSYLDNVVDRYCNMFWNLQNSNSNAFQRFLETTTDPTGQKKLIEVYQRPSAAKRREYTQNMRNTVYAYLKPYVNEMMEDQYDRYLSTIYNYFLQLEQSMNQEYVIELVDPKVESFTSSEYYGHRITLSEGVNAEPLFAEYWEIGKTCKLRFTAWAWTKFGCPSMLLIHGNPEDFSIHIYKEELTLEPGLNTVTLGEPTDPIEGSIVGKWERRIDKGTTLLVFTYVFNEDGTGYQSTAIIDNWEGGSTRTITDKIDSYTYSDGEINGTISYEYDGEWKTRPFTLSNVRIDYFTLTYTDDNGDIVFTRVDADAGD